MAKPYRRKGSRFYWIAPWICGKQVPRSSQETDYDKALRKLKILEGKLASNSPITPRTDRDSFAELLELERKDLKIKRRANLRNVERTIDKRLIPAMGHLPAGKVTGDVIADYILSRQNEHWPDGRPRLVANATINRELEVIGRACRLGLESGAVSAVPKIEMLEEDNRREGFFEDHEFRAVLNAANPLLRDVLVLAYHTGWRQASVLSLAWAQVDLVGGVMRLRRRDTKNRKSTVFPINIFPELRSMLEARHEHAVAMETRLRIDIPNVFHRDGQPVKSIQASWNKARVQAGVPKKLFHDFRRTAVRHLKKLGFSESEVMDMVGFKTRQIFDRYDIIVEADILKTAEEVARRRAGATLPSQEPAPATEGSLGSTPATLELPRTQKLSKSIDPRSLDKQTNTVGIQRQLLFPGDGDFAQQTDPAQPNPANPPAQQMGGSHER